VKYDAVPNDAHIAAVINEVVATVSFNITLRTADSSVLFKLFSIIAINNEMLIPVSERIAPLVPLPSPHIFETADGSR